MVVGCGGYVRWGSSGRVACGVCGGGGCVCRYGVAAGSPAGVSQRPGPLHPPILNEEGQCWALPAAFA